METQEIEFVRKDYVDRGYHYFRPRVPLELADKLGWKDGDRFRWVLDEENQQLVLKKVN